MVEIGFVASLEQYSPREAVELAAVAAGHGFDGVVLADRFQPWLPAHGNASHVWTVAGAVGERTDAWIAVSAVPGYRAHPASVAQATVTAESLRPGRHRLLLSGGDAIDEHVVGSYWPEAPERAERLFDAHDVIRKLLGTARRGSDARHSGPHYRLESSRLWTGRDVPPVLVWAGGPVTARRAGRTADGIVVGDADVDRLSRLLGAARDGRRESGRESRMRTAVHVQLAWAPTDAEAAEQALREWPMAGLRFPRGDIRSPFDVEHLVRAVSADDLAARMTVSADPSVHLARLRQLVGLGFDTVHIHNVTRDQRGWLEVFGREIAPELSRTRS
ncbi:LLM class flavin-dependent oxidoreductase [Tsukamurella sp. 8F]|uniref:LLM class flavin-dependent oxidoreductase n=1 Tax=unclassified Tsukamurella TaxID=2633480 RepID=UPI0023BA10C3|nr:MULTISPECIES: LLM class flavin-dependent oxidoreductase [unclassified Tsukamurella]MDF0531538.1 LLM class flavin-dependent oxidoreductase [Tsukamurella sp. 8J]MDF0588850.1 LLM class flavin-dependent oxidoreductase [Tsukamurella sp. 8F]